MGDVFKMLNLSDDIKIFRGYTEMIELYNAPKFITLLFLIPKIVIRFNRSVAFLKSVRIYKHKRQFKYIVLSFEISVSVFNFVC